jgi:hypothetical protein
MIADFKKISQYKLEKIILPQANYRTLLKLRKVNKYLKESIDEYLGL